MHALLPLLGQPRMQLSPLAQGPHAKYERNY